VKDYGVTKDALRLSVAHAFRKRVPANPLQWMPWHVRFPESWEATAFDFDMAPHVRGVIERGWLNPLCRKMNLQWATRLMKTSTLLSLICWVASEAPAPMVVLFGDRMVLTNTVSEQMYPMFEATRPVRKQLPPDHKRNKRVVRFSDCSLRLANAGTMSDASGFPARYVFKFEHEKIPMPSVGDAESDASRRIEKRTTGYARGVKICEEGSPVSAAESRVHKLRQSGSVVELYLQVPCPHCREYQVLEFERVKWDRDEVGEQTPALAERTARYICCRCENEIHNHNRAAMMRACRWVADGEFVDADGVICGKPKIDSDTYIFGPLSKLYSLLISGWGVVAREFVEACEAQRNGDLQALKNFITETLGQVWIQKAGSVAVSELAEHLKGEHSLKECPDGTVFLVTAADVGYSGDDMLFHWMTQGWARGGQGAIVDFGLIVGKSKWFEFLSREYPVAGSGLMLPVKEFLVGMDSGKYSTEVYELVSQMGGRAIAMKGDSRTDRGNNVDLYSWGYQRADKDPRLLKMQRDIGEGDLLMISTESSQQYRIALTSKRVNRGDRGFVSLPVDLVQGHETYKSWFAQWTADYKDGAKWQRSGANEAGDQIRYCRALAELHTKNGSMWDVVSLPRRFAVNPSAQAMEARTDRPALQNVFHESRFLVSQR
jgi:phage terminase large subunit GpA-like protein